MVFKEKYLKDKDGNCITIFGKPIVISKNIPQICCGDIVFGKYKDINIFKERRDYERMSR